MRQMPFLVDSPHRMNRLNMVCFYDFIRINVALLLGLQPAQFNWLSGTFLVEGGKEALMTCKSCGSDKQHKFTAEIAIHFPGFKGLNKPIVWVFPELFLCLNCGKAEFVVPDNDLRTLAKDYSASAG